MEIRDLPDAAGRPMYELRDMRLPPRAVKLLRSEKEDDLEHQIERQLWNEPSAPDSWLPLTSTQRHVTVRRDGNAGSCKILAICDIDVFVHDSLEEECVWQLQRVVNTFGPEHTRLRLFREKHGQDVVDRVTKDIRKSLKGARTIDIEVR
jgi:hypothetical protein